MLSLPIDTEDFLANYWQKKPLLMRNAVPDFEGPITPEELAGLSLEAPVESRIVSQQGGVWQLQQGPFDTRDFQRHDLWTLLVQRVDHWVPEVAALKELVAFLPNWRFDDVMVSYAVDGGSVGPHFDRYDVFLLQGQGERLWRLGDYCDETTPRLQHEQLHLLESFSTCQEYVLQPGDVLYVPPGLAHWGIAQGDCMTYSLGFRAPPIANVMARLTDVALDLLEPTLLLEDRDSVTGPARSGEITQAQIHNAREAVINALRALDDGRALAELVTEPNWDPDEQAPPLPLLPGPVSVPPWSRVVWLDRGDTCDVVANGESAQLPPSVIPLLERLCRGDGVTLTDSDDEDADALLDFLYSVGALVNTEGALMEPLKNARETLVAQLEQASRHVDILSPSLEPHLLDDQAVVDAITRLACRGRQSRIRILVSGIEPVEMGAHKLLAVARRLSTAVTVKVLDTHPEWNGETVVLIDRSSGLLVSTQERRAHTVTDRAEAQRWAERFERLWLAGHESPELRQFH